MAKRTYSQYCGLAHALDIVGDRWTLLIVRDLATGPRRFGDLLRGSPGLSTNLLSERLKQLEDARIIERIVAGRGVAYALTQDGERLAGAIAPLGAWGAARLGPLADRAFRPEWLMFSLRAAFKPDEARGVYDCYEFRVSGHAIWAVIEDGEIELTTDKPCEPDFTITTDVPTLAKLGGGTVSIEEAVASGAAVARGDPAAGGRALAILGTA
jgi:DNA-binding HxlR family transcriptional regulator